MKIQAITILIVFLVNSLFLKEFSTSDDYLKKRIDCYPEAPYSFGDSIEEKCRSRNCLYQPTALPNVPWCFFPQESYGYKMVNVTNLSNGYKFHLTRLTKYLSPFPDPVEELILDIEYLNTKILHVKIYDAKNKRYEVPVDLNDIRDKNSFNSDLSFAYENNNDLVFVLKVIRKSTGEILFDTSIGGLVFCDQFIQVNCLNLY